MTAHHNREIVVNVVGGGRCGEGRQEEGTYSKTIHTAKEASLNFLRLSQNSQLKVMLVTHLKYAQLNSMII